MASGWWAAEMRLYHAEGACSGVTLDALRRTGLPHDVVTVDLRGGEQHGPAFRAISPDGKVPALRVGDLLLTENPSIVLFLDELAPEAALLPRPPDAAERARVVSDLVWCGATLHPLARGFYNPARVTDGDGAGVRARSKALIEPIADRVETRLATQPHWFGTSWSIVDPYVGYLFGLIRRGGFDLDRYPRLATLVDAAPPAGI